MAALFDTNRALTIRRNKVDLETVVAHVGPAQPEVKPPFGFSTPAAKVFSIYIPELPDVREQDLLISTSPAESYRVTAVEQFDVDLVRHTHVIAEGKWGS